MAYQLDPIGPEDRVRSYAAPAEGEAPPHRGVLATALTLVVMAAFAGGLWFAYDEGHRTAGTGEIPLIRADASPMKVKPANPGGMKIPDRNMLVYNEAHPTVERLLPPPEKPMPRPEPPAPAQPSPPPAAASAAPPATPAAAMPAPVSPPRVAAAPAATTADAKATPEKSAADAATAGGIRVQLGSLRSAEAAHREWERIRHKNLDLLGRLSVSTSRADLGDRGVYYRILAGPIADAGAAERLCGELKQRDVGCLVVR